MKKRNNATFIITSVVCLLPLILSLAVYDRLPEQISVQWDSAGNPSNIVPKAVAAIGLPVLFLAVNILSKILLFNDPRRPMHLPGVLRIISVWTPPLLSIVLVPVTLFIAMGASIPIHALAPPVLGVVFIIYGNYMPKIRQNYTSGIKLPWTLHSANNWNRTHRVGGYAWIVGGVVLIAASFLAGDAALWGFPLILCILVALLGIPIVYSYVLYRKTRGSVDSVDD